MAYLALARKYRPQRFADMIGQEHVTRTLENAIKSDRVHHAYLFCGVRGLGKTTAARILAKALVCEHGPTPEPCNECVQCVGINEGRSVDVIEIDGASNNSVEDIRSLRDQVNYLPQSARRKIYIIDEVHMLSQAAFNALLKTLEEPPPHVTFMFATTDPHKVLPTILSRVSRLDYRRVRAATLSPYLEKILEQEGFAVEREGLNVIARCGEGSVRDSLTLLDKVLAFASDPKNITTEEVLQVLGQAGRFAVATLIDAVLARDAKLVLARFEEMTSTGSDLMRLAVAIMQHLRDLAVVKLTGSRDALLDMSDDLYDHLRRQADSVEASIISQHFDRFARIVDNIDNSRVPRLVIEMGLLELCNAEPLMPLGDLVARLDALASGAPSFGGGSGGGGGGRGRAPAGRHAAEREAAPPAMRAAPQRPQQQQQAQRPPAQQAQHPPAQRAQHPPAQHPPAQQAQRPPTQQARPPAQQAQRPPAQRSPAQQAQRPSNGQPSFEQLAQALLRGASNGGGGGGGGPAHHQAPTQAPRAPTPPAQAPHAQAPRAPSPAQGPRAPTHAPPQPETPASAPATFALSATQQAPSGPRRDAGGCPSSRSTPRDAIAWRELDQWDAWETFLSCVRGEHNILSGVLSAVGLVSLREGVVELAAPSTGLAQTQLRENPEFRTAFEHLTGVYFGEPMRLELLDVTPSLPHTPSLELVELERQRQHREQIVHEARTNPQLRSLLDTFSGEMRHVEPLSGPTLPPLGERGLPQK